MKQGLHDVSGTGLPWHAARPDAPRVPAQSGAAGSASGPAAPPACAASTRTASRRCPGRARSCSGPRCAARSSTRCAPRWSTGELCPGEVYSAPALGERFGVSATPVREAMQQLALEGAVEVVPNRGFRVCGAAPASWRSWRRCGR